MHGFIKEMKVECWAGKRNLEKDAGKFKGKCERLEKEIKLIKRK